MRSALVSFIAALGALLLIACTHTTERAGHEEPVATANPTDGDDNGDSEEAMIDPMGPNSACYVCHMTFVKEEISRIHLAEEIGCVKCHGLSAAHANDEDIGATKPDIMFARNEVDKACGKCHPTHDAPATEVVARFVERELPKEPTPVCTDCHGEHRVAEAAEEQ